MSHRYSRPQFRDDIFPFSFPSVKSHQSNSSRSRIRASTMAPLHRRATELNPQTYIAIISVAALFICSVFCYIVFYNVCNKQRRRENAMRRMQRERTPSVGAQYVAPSGAQSNQQLRPYPQQPSRQDVNACQYSEPLELQGSGRPGPPPAHQIDRYTAAVCVRSCLC